MTEQDAERRSRLIGIKLRALVRDHLGADDSALDPAETSLFAPGAALVHDGTAWVFLADRPGSMLGAALAWMLRAGADRLAIVAEQETGILARRAAAFSAPIEVWFADGRVLLPAVAEPLSPPPSVPAHHESFRALIDEAGAEPQTEHGVLFGDVHGLEVCRVVDDPDLGTTRLEVGVGAHDREAFQMLHGDVPTVESLRRIVRTVMQHRRVDASPHPLNRLAAERLLRWRVLGDPGVVGAAELAPAEPPVPRTNLKDPVPCVAAGRGTDGRPIVVVCSTGVDLDLVPYAVDARAAVEAAAPNIAVGETRLVLVTPARDRLRVTEDLVGLLGQSVELVSID